MRADEAADARIAPLGFGSVVVTEEAAVAGLSGIEIEISGARVRVSRGVDLALLADVLWTLKGLG